MYSVVLLDFSAVHHRFLLSFLHPVILSLVPTCAFSVTLMFSHRVSGANNSLEYFDGIASALNASGNVSAATHKFSRLNALDTFRDVDGALHLRMMWKERDPSSCLEILTCNPGALSGTYTIVTSKNLSLSVWCDMTTDSGGYDVMHAVRSWFRLFAIIRCMSY